MANNAKIYRETIQTNLRDIEDILKNLGIKKEVPISLYREALNASAKNILSKWVSGKKYCRTEFVQKALGKLYPEKHTQLSLSVDAMVNILDDFFDETLDKQVKGEYVIELLRVLSLYNKNYITSKQIQRSLGTYFNKLITVALTEQFYQQKIARGKDMEKIIKDSADLLLCRSKDIDVFMEIGLLDFKNQILKSKIQKLARIFRAINILKKDIKDIKQDKKNNIDTVIVLMSDKGKAVFASYVKGLLDYFLNKEIKTLGKEDLKSLLIKNLNQMIEKDKREILNLI